MRPREAREVSLLYALWYVACAGDQQNPGTFERLIDVQAARSRCSCRRRSGRSPRPSAASRWSATGSPCGPRGRSWRSRRPWPSASSTPHRCRPRDHYPQLSPQGALIKMEAFYDAPFCRDAGLTGAAVSGTGPAKICYDITPADNALGGLLGFVGGDEARRWGSDHDGLRNAVVGQFVTFFGPRAGRPNEVAVQDWNDEVWSRGAPVNLLGPGSLTADRGAIWAPGGRIHWACTETATYWHGYTDGAITSGRRAAREVLGG